MTDERKTVTYTWTGRDGESYRVVRVDQGGGFIPLIFVEGLGWDALGEDSWRTLEQAKHGRALYALAMSLSEPSDDG